jgi:hypothetical protein
VGTRAEVLTLTKIEVRAVVECADDMEKLKVL